MADKRADVFISGAGPVGLVLGYHLSQLGLSVYIVDSDDKASPAFPMYGRACSLFPRTLEILDQLNLYDEMAQVAFTAPQSLVYKDGMIAERGNAIFDAIARDETGTYFKACFNIRLKHSEDIFRKRLSDMNVPVHAPVKLVDFSFDENADDDYKIKTSCTDVEGKSFEITSKYIVGCDGGSSTVRRLAQIPFVGEMTAVCWVRVDGVVETDLPEERAGFGMIQSQTHGHVIWAALDHGGTRIGYVLSEELSKKYGMKMTAEEAVYEAKRALAPFHLDFTRVDWHTVYGVQQHVADQLQDRERILLAGDAAHTHSSGTAQGMNAGMHDVASLSWRLAGVLKGWYKAEVLANYSDERRAIAQQLIDNDKIVSVLISGKKPEKFGHRPEDPPVLLQEVMQEQADFSIGLGVSYPSNLLNDLDGSSQSSIIVPGHRAPDILLQKPGAVDIRSRLYEVARNNAKFRILVFAGDPSSTVAALKALRTQVDENAAPFSHAVEFITIIAGQWHALDEYLGVRRFGAGYWDPDHAGHAKYGVSLDQGALLVIRPDGILGLVSPLNDYRRVTLYLDRLIFVKDPSSSVTKVSNILNERSLGEFVTPDEHNRTIPPRL